MYWEKVVYFSAKHSGLYILYNFLVSLVGIFLVPASFFNRKLRLFYKGRRAVFSSLEMHLESNAPRIWVHAASLGEYEQGLPVVKELRTRYPHHQILITFFSPSGYEVKKNSPDADLVTYLPLDTRSNSRRFLDLVKPEVAIFIKYEVWPNYLRELSRRNIPVILISAIFNKKQIYFRPYGAFMLRALKQFRHYFVQDIKSANLLKEVGIQNSTVSGDTRFDRVAEILQQKDILPRIASFVNKNRCIVAGSTWPEDEKLLVPYINQTDKPVKFILVPHDIKKEHIQNLQRSIQKPVTTFSELKTSGETDFSVLIVDAIGLLTRIYQFGQVAYVGGGFATGLHNTLEPAVYGIPVLIGPQYEGFREAEELVSLEGVFSVNSAKELNQKLDELLENEELRNNTGRINSDYINRNLGATTKIIHYLQHLLSRPKN
ncbi:3-deoxy-D-manno-octulosonic acid transferase [Lentiprolixibacter aurantiacus]|uniref:3-deoxy-D-manno-octulosonic acid transferase n=1 Tax=Lentiprolixibacter aurantiacus TaxID=2993939 RepID=A0AAE3SMS0_9FLAO|nr:glycosyltransferase N-terminal domain-containing protein [Lentiprolixibacter aurantiacus]MCX2718977.1 3-deoxy-D-manno-octulosonic acid transferase [Lentiprolixibacter aurantiacus]